MPPSAIIIFGIALAFNIIARLALGFLGHFRQGVDAVLFCSILAGYYYGVKAGLLYGALIAAAFFVINISWAGFSFYAVPLNAVIGALAALFSGLPLLTVVVALSLLYYIVSFFVMLVFYRTLGPGYILFVLLNFLTTYFLTGVVVGFG